MTIKNKKRHTIVMIGFAAVALVALGYARLQEKPATPQQPQNAIVQAGDKTIDTSILDAQTRTLIAEKREEGLAPNRLIFEKSPYLLQHAFNPVDWYPWGEDAFEKANAEHKPIFLSVGYSTCYWCHVMERKVFEHDSLAAVLNRYFVSIKVDREERPDVDRVYMQALQAMTRGGGWPMSMFLTPDLKPFFGATYIPPTARYGRPGFGDVARAIHRSWIDKNQEVVAQAEKIADYLRNASLPQTEPTRLGEPALRSAFEWYSQEYDPEFGGFGNAPKFPRPVSLDFLMRYHKHTGDAEALEMTLTTLRRMARGGMYDHVGQGFHRYSTDKRWHVPHFEKMLYDQAQLTSTYLNAFEITGDSLYATVARNVLAYVDRMMLHHEGGFYSAEDAESAVDPSRPDEKEEGAFYTWTKSEVDRILDPADAEVFESVYGTEGDGNAEPDPHGEFVGENILRQVHTMEEAAESFGISSAEVSSTIEESRRILFEAREERPKPHLDDKIILSWNGLMISAYANAYGVFGDEHYREVAERTTEFLIRTLYSEETGLFRRRYRSGEARYDAHLEDYAFFIKGLIDLHQSTGEERWLEWAQRLADTMLDRFYDDKLGGFFATAGEDESILVRSKEYYDGAEPSGNSVAIWDLVQLYEITGREAYRSKAEQSLAYFGQIIQRGPASPVMLLALSQLRVSG